MRTDLAQAIIVIAKRILSNVAAGRVYPQETVRWAHFIVANNTPQEPASLPPIVPASVAEHPIQIRRGVGEWEREGAGQMAPAGPWDALA
jgi:hypothetical protein